MDAGTDGPLLLLPACTPLFLQLGRCICPVRIGTSEPPEQSKFLRRTPRKLRRTGQPRLQQNQNSKDSPSHVLRIRKASREGFGQSKGPLCGNHRQRRDCRFFPKARAAFCVYNRPGRSRSPLWKYMPFRTLLFIVCHDHFHAKIAGFLMLWRPVVRNV